MTGVDLTQIDAIDVTTAMTILSEAGCRYEQMENGAPFCILAAAVSRQSDHGGKIIGKGETTDQESGQHRLADGSQHLTTKAIHTWERSFADYEPSSGPPLQLRRWRPSADWCIACCATGCHS